MTYPTILKTLRSQLMKGSTLLLLVAPLLLLTRCCCDDEENRLTDSTLKLSFDWTNHPDAYPSSVAIGIFAEGAQPVQAAFYGRDGGEVAVVGQQTYQLVGFNDDSEALFTRGESYNEFEIYAQPTTLTRLAPMFRRASQAPRAGGTEEETVVMEPDHLYVSTCDGITLPPAFITEVTMPMDRVTTEYHFTINNVENLSYAVSIMGTLTGMSGSWFPAQHRASDTHCIIPFSFAGEGSTIDGTVRTFGHCPEPGEQNNHFLVIYAEMKDGTKVYFTTDVTANMHDVDHLIPDAGGTGHTEIPIVIDQLPLPKPIINGSGLQPSVAEWSEVSVAIKM